MGTFPPPTAPPPFLTTYDRRRPDATAWSVTVDRPGRVAGVPEPGGAYRDVIVEAQLRLQEGDAADAYGLFVRKAPSGRYLALAVTAAGGAWIRHFDGRGFDDLAVGPLAPGIPFDRGTDAANLFQVVACGPGVTFALNNHPVLAITVAPGLAEGEVGCFTAHGGSSVRATALVDWLQVRPVLAAAPIG